MTATFDFSANQITAETTKEYTFDLIPGRPSVILAPAHDSNPDFMEERLRRQIKMAEEIANAPRGTRSTQQTPEDLKREIEEDREADRVLISKTCARAWGRAPKAVDGSEPEFSEANCYAFFKALPDYMFDPLRGFAANLYNFVPRPPVTDEEACALGN